MLHVADQNVASASEHQVATDGAGQATGQVNGRASNTVAVQIGHADIGTSGPANGQSKPGQQEHGKASSKSKSTCLWPKDECPVFFEAEAPALKRP